MKKLISVREMFDDRVKAALSKGNPEDNIPKVYLHKYLASFKDTVTGEMIEDYEIVSRNNLVCGNDFGKDANAVTIIAITPENEIIMQHEYRFPLADYCLEFPSGLIDPGETAEQAAIRELKEETNLDCLEVLQVVNGGFSSPGMTDEKVAVVILRVDGEIKARTGKEEIKAKRVPVEQAYKEVMNPRNKVGARPQLFLMGYMAALRKGNTK